MTNRKPVVSREIPEPYPEWENDTHTVERLEQLLTPFALKHRAELFPGEIYAIRRAIRLIKAR